MLSDLKANSVGKGTHRFILIEGNMPSPFAKIPQSSLQDKRHGKMKLDQK
jgi:hypothetical protein